MANIANGEGAPAPQLINLMELTRLVNNWVLAREHNHLVWPSRSALLDLVQKAARIGYEAAVTHHVCGQAYGASPVSATEYQAAQKKLNAEARGATDGMVTGATLGGLGGTDPLAQQPRPRPIVHDRVIVRIEHRVSPHLLQFEDKQGVVMSLQPHGAMVLFEGDNCAGFFFDRSITVQLEHRAAASAQQQPADIKSMQKQQEAACIKSIEDYRRDWDNAQAAKREHDEKASLARQLQQACQVQCRSCREASLGCARL